MREYSEEEIGSRWSVPLTGKNLSRPTCTPEFSMSSAKSTLTVCLGEVPDTSSDRRLQLDDLFPVQSLKLGHQNTGNTGCYSGFLVIISILSFAERPSNSKISLIWPVDVCPFCFLSLSLPIIILSNVHQAPPPSHGIRFFDGVFQSLMVRVAPPVLGSPPGTSSAGTKAPAPRANSTNVTSFLVSPGVL